MDTTVTNATMGIIPVKYNNDEITVLGRDLHAALEIKSHYRDWIKNMIAYGFEEGVDYVKFYETPENNENGEMVESRRLNFSGTEVNEVDSKFDVKTNHQLKLDMAKEIAMIQRSEAGRKVRKYFIEVEKRYKQQAKSFGEIPMSHSSRNLALIDAGQQAITLNQYFGVRIEIARVHAINQVEKTFDVDLADIKKLLPPVDDVPVTYNPTQLAAKLTNTTGTKYTARKINMMLAELGYQYKNNGEWVLTADGKRYGTSYPYERNGHSGFQILWNEEILTHFTD